LAAVAVIGIGQLYQRGIRLPTAGPWGDLAEVINQLCIFLPIILLPRLRGQPYHTAWLPATGIAPRMAWGVLLAILSVIVFTLVRAGSSPFWVVLPNMLHLESVPMVVQVFCEDMVIAIVAVRLAAALPRGEMVVALLVGALFTAGHIPAMAAQGVQLQEMALLLLDAALGFGIILVLQRGRDIWWFFWVHTAMDLTQFSRISGVGMGGA
jgi:hypothetical protein